MIRSHFTEIMVSRDIVKLLNCSEKWRGGVDLAIAERDKNIFDLFDWPYITVRF